MTESITRFIHQFNRLVSTIRLTLEGLMNSNSNPCKVLLETIWICYLDQFYLSKQSQAIRFVFA